MNVLIYIFIYLLKPFNHRTLLYSRELVLKYRRQNNGEFRFDRTEVWKMILTPPLYLFMISVHSRLFYFNQSILIIYYLYDLLQDSYLIQSSIQNNSPALRDFHCLIKLIDCVLNQTTFYLIVTMIFFDLDRMDDIHLFYIDECSEPH